jgi:hypothetical protein
MSTLVIRIPAADLAAELEFGIAYTAACNPGRDLLGADRKLFARALADLLFERARSGTTALDMAVPGENGAPPGSTST